MDIVATIGAQQLEAGTEAADVMYHDTAQRGPQLCDELCTDVVRLHDVANSLSPFRVGFDVGVTAFNVLGQCGPILFNIAQQFYHIFVVVADSHGNIAMLQGKERFEIGLVGLVRRVDNVNRYGIDLLGVEVAFL